MSLRAPALAAAVAALSFVAPLSRAARAQEVTPLDDLVMPREQLLRVRAALPEVAYPELAAVFASRSTLWYDAQSMTPTYQKSTGGAGFWGVEANAKWFDGIPNEEPDLNREGRRFVQPEKGTWVFPFATIAGTDDATNVYGANFLALPKAADGIHVTPLVLSRRESDVEAGMRTWVWTFPVGTVIGEVIFLKDGDRLLPSEVRTRIKHKAGWATNVFRPFPTAADLAAAVKARRPAWAQSPALQTLVAHLGDPKTLTPSGLHGGLAGTFDQDGYLDVLPDFGDAALVRELLTTTPFRSAYGAVWKQNGTQKTYAASTTSRLSVVPERYTAGLIEVSDQSCARCHEQTGRLIDHWTDSLVLYGEIWGKDQIFTFQPFDESYYPQLALEGVEDNRHMNPRLVAAGVIAWEDGLSDGAETVRQAN